MLEKQVNLVYGRWDAVFILSRIKCRHVLPREKLRRVSYSTKDILHASFSRKKNNDTSNLRFLGHILLPDCPLCVGPLDE